MKPNCDSPTLTGRWLAPRLVVLLALVVFPLARGAEEAGVDFEHFRPAQIRSVATLKELQAALASAKPGDCIEAADGDYAAPKTLAVASSGTPAAPIVIRAKNTGRARLTGGGGFYVKNAQYVVICGFDFSHRDDNAALRLQGCRHVRFTRNVVHIKETPAGKTEKRLHWIEMDGEDSHHNRVDHNLIEEKHNSGVMVVTGGSGAATHYQSSREDRIDHNYFHNFYHGRSNGYETIRLGTSAVSHSSGHTIVEDNLFENCDGEAEIVSVKTNENTVRRNTFLNSRGMLTLRNCHACVAENNCFLNPSGKKGAEGIRFTGRTTASSAITSKA